MVNHLLLGHDHHQTHLLVLAGFLVAQRSWSYRIPITPDPSLSTLIEEVIDRLAGSGADLEITMNIHATKPKGFTETEKRIISENSQTLKFGYYGFERG